ncbi:conjugal transfer protein TraB, partial [Photobacterium iliopiscarium]
PAGVVSTINPSDALMNMGGSALENIGSKLADYYIKLAEQYHPIIELNPGSIANLVFLEGFPLDADKIAEYEQRVSGADISQTVANFTNPLMSMMGGQTVPINPLANQLLPQLNAKAQAFDALRQTTPTVQKPY